MAEDYVRWTAVTQLPVDDEQRESLEETISEWKRGCQLAADMAWGTCNAKSDVQPLAYDDVRERIRPWELALDSRHSPSHRSHKRPPPPPVQGQDQSMFMHPQ